MAKKKFSNAFQNEVYIAVKQIEQIKEKIKLEEVLKDFLPLKLEGVDVKDLIVGQISGDKLSEYRYVGVIELLNKGQKVGSYAKAIDLEKNKIAQQLDLYGVVSDSSHPIR